MGWRTLRIFWLTVEHFSHHAVAFSEQQLQRPPIQQYTVTPGLGPALESRIFKVGLDVVLHNNSKLNTNPGLHSDGSLL